ncbi:unnamed protein product [Penicillium olsonii]|uniref:Rhodopsin domain-containing protein n=1 Tax=Penicillium olsonii TaxID=99116 RepID=A0A9W4HGS6_PENOL|nr:unnamed protein product [Penicillium olsonii]
MLNIHLPYVRRLITSTIQRQKLIPYTVAKGVGVGYHITSLSQTSGTFESLKKCIFALQILDYPLSVVPAKIALLIFYARIFTIRKFRIAAYVVGLLVLAYGLAALFGFFFQCRPLEYIWDRTIPGGKCVWRLQVYRILSPINCITGILIIILPIPTVWKLHAPRGQKLALTGVFLLGGVGTVASILTMVIFFSLGTVAMDEPKCKKYLVHSTMLRPLTLCKVGFSVELGILVILESGIIIVAACLVSIWPLFTRLIPRRLHASFSRTPREEHRTWYLRDTSANTKSTERNERHKEVHLIREEPWNGSPSSPCSLADLEDQRLSILNDTTIETCMSDGKQCSIKSTV